MRKFILLFFLLYVAKYGNSMPVSQSTLLSVRRMIHALPRCDNVCLFLWLLFQDAGVCQLCQLCHGKKNHSAAATRSHPSRQSSPNIDCKRFAPTLYWVIIVWLLGGYCAIHPLCLCNLFHIAIITSTKTYVRRGCYISLFASSQQHTIGERRYDQLVVGCQASADTDVNILA